MYLHGYEDSVILFVCVNDKIVIIISIRDILIIIPCKYVTLSIININIKLQNDLAIALYCLG